MRERVALLSFDLEEFDLPLEHGLALSADEQIRVSSEGCDALTSLLDAMDVRATFFVTAHYARARPEQVRALARRHEIASHGMQHGSFRPSDLAESRSVLEEIAGVPVRGFRRPRMEATDEDSLRAAGYAYDASENPTWIPGRYNNFFMRRTVRTSSGLVRIPASVTPLVRFPLFWLSFKNVPPVVYRAASALNLASDGYLALYFHPWELADLSGFGLPRHVAGLSGTRLLNRMSGYLAWLGARAGYVTHAEFAASRESPDAAA